MSSDFAYATQCSRGSFMRIDKFTSRLQMALADAQSLAVGKDHNFIEPVHLLQAMLDQRDASAATLLQQARADVARLRNELAKAIDRLAVVKGNAGDVHLSNDLARLFNIADKLAQQRKDQYISSEVVLLAALEDRGSAGQLLRDAGGDKKRLEQAIEKVRGGERVNDPAAEESRQALERFTVDLTERAAQGKLDPVIGRDDEIRRTIQVLQRRRKNNPVLIGEPGVGKTAIVEGL